MEQRIKMMVDSEEEIARRFERIQADLNYLISAIPTGVAREQLSSGNIFIQGAKVHVHSLIVIAKEQAAAIARQL